MELEQVLSKVQAIAGEVASKEAIEADETCNWAEKSIRALQREGLAGLVIPKKFGGLGYGLFALAKVSEILGSDYGSAGLCFGMHNVGAAVISAKATPEQAEKFLKPICDGNHITTLALSEAGSGSHFYFPQTSLEKISPGLYRVAGNKTFVTNGSFADSYVVSTVGAEPSSPAHHFSCVVIPKEEEGLEWKGEWKGLGMRGNSSIGCLLNNVQIPSSNILGKEGDQLWYILNIVAPYFLTAMSGTYLGIAEAAFKEAQEHLLKRLFQHNGSYLSESNILQHKLGVLWAKIESARSLIYSSAQLFDNAEPAAISQILASKAIIAETAVFAVNEAMTIVGGIGYRENSKLDRLMRDARAAHIMAPTTDILYTWIGRVILNQPVLAE